MSVKRCVRRVKTPVMRHEKMQIGRRTRCLLTAAVLGCASAALGQTIPSAIQMVTVTPQTGSFYTSNVMVPVEDNYIPNVVWRENGGGFFYGPEGEGGGGRGAMFFKSMRGPQLGQARRRHAGEGE